MDFDGWLSIGVVAAVLLLLATSRLGPDIIMVGGVVVLLLLDVLEPGEALAGLANEGMVTIGVLFVVGAGVVETGAIGWLAEILLGRPRGVRRAVLRVTAPTAVLSAFLNNTPLVAMLIPVVTDWAKKLQISPSKLLIPLSYAAILGGTCTLIGTSTNLVVNGLILKAVQSGDGSLAAAAGLPSGGLKMFDITLVGLACAAAGMAFLVLVGRWLLPDRAQPINQLADPRQYTVEMVVSADSPLVGKTIEAAGLRHLGGVFLMEINRQETVLPAVSPQEKLQAHDRLVFVGVVESVADLQRIRGLVPATDQVFKLASPRSSRTLIEAVVSDSCPAVNRTIRDAKFRSHYGAVVIAAARNGERINKKIGDIVLRSGDTLLLEAQPSFVEQYRNSRDFFLVSQLENFNPPSHERAPLALAILAAMVAAVTMSDFLGLDITMLKASLVAAALMLATGCLSPAAARRAIDWQVLLTIAASFGLGAALEKTGAAAVLAQTIIGLAGRDPWVALVLVYVVAAAATEIITNNAAAALMFPLALATAGNLGVSPMPFCIVLMIAASNAFITPIGYQTNLMVYGPGGYRFADYVRIGMPLSLVVGTTALLVTPLVWPLRP